MTWGVIEEMLYILLDMIEKIIKSLYLYFLKRVFVLQKSYNSWSVRPKQVFECSLTNAESLSRVH